MVQNPNGMTTETHGKGTGREMVLELDRSGLTTARLPSHDGVGALSTFSTRARHSCFACFSEASRKCSTRSRWAVGNRMWTAKRTVFVRHRFSKPNADALNFSSRRTRIRLKAAEWPMTKSAQSVRITEGDMREVELPERFISHPLPCRSSFRVIPWSPSDKSATSSNPNFATVFN